LEWLTRSFQEHSVAWILLSSFLGGVIGASVRFVFEDLLRPWLGWRRDERRVVKRYTVPLIRTADTLERRINIMIRNAGQQWFATDEYFRLSTLYQFGELLGWIRILEREIGFLPLESTRRGRRFRTRLYGVFRALASHAYFRRWGPSIEAIEATLVPRLMLSAIGEVMTRGGEVRETVEFTEFLSLYANDPKVRRYFQELETFLAGALPADPLRWDRLIACAANLRALVRFLDRNGAMTNQRDVAHLDKLLHPEIAAQLTSELAEYVSSSDRLIYSRDVTSRPAG
jgi:hypothetical protein